MAISKYPQYSALHIVDGVERHRSGAGAGGLKTAIQCLWKIKNPQKMSRGEKLVLEEGKPTWTIFDIGLTGT